MRIYLPATMSVVRQALSAGSVPVRSGIGFAVTGPLRLEYPDWSEEDLEYLAMQDAARASLRLLAGEAQNDPLRVVIAADVEDTLVVAQPERDRAVVAVAGGVHWSTVAAVHVDGADAIPAVREAVSAIDAADLGDDDADFLVTSAEDFDLAWYAPGEIGYLIEELGTP